MASGTRPPKGGKLDELLSEARKYRDQRSSMYRDQALKIFPWICARCGREFSGKKLRELTVHHKDHNHDNNPPDGSNWELLCSYCHDMEHQKYLHESEREYDAPNEAPDPDSGYKPFAALKDLLAKKE
jgi:hypothetical protein